MYNNDENRLAILYYKALGYTPKIIANQLHLDEKYVLNVMLNAEIKQIFKNGTEKA